MRAWLAEHLELPPRFDTLAEEIAWGREWQARMAAELRDLRALVLRMAAELGVDPEA